MNGCSKFPPSPRPSLHETLSECYDALLSPTLEGDLRDPHVQVLIETLTAAELAPSLRSILEQALCEFQKGPVHPLDTEARETCAKLASRLAAWMKEANVPRFVYHGTIYGRLSSIQRYGLVPGANPVWKERYVSRQHCDGAVFFELTWRSALNWAMSAHSSSRGPRKGRHRTPVVLRLPMAGLALEPDPKAITPLSCMVRAAVPLIAPYVLVGTNMGFPAWRSLPEVLSDKTS